MFYRLPGMVPDAIIRLAYFFLSFYHQACSKIKPKLMYQQKLCMVQKPCWVDKNKCHETQSAGKARDSARALSALGRPCSSFLLLFGCYY